MLPIGSTLMSVVLGLSLWSCNAISTFERPYRFQLNDGRFFSYQNSDGQFHVGNWTIDGVTTGNFGWLDSLGIETALQFIADDKGYRILRKHSSYNPQRGIFHGKKFKGGLQEPMAIVEDLIGDHEHAIIANEFQYVTPNSFRVEQRRKTGIVYGKYGFVDAAGRLIVVYYTAHARRGFLVTRQLFDPSRGQTFKMADIYKAPLRDVAAEYNLKEYYRGARK